MMLPGKTISSLAYATGTYIGKALGSIVLLIVIARNVDITSFGVLSLSLIVGTLVGAVIDYGDQIKLPRDIARATPRVGRARSAKSLTAKLALSVLVLLATYSLVAFSVVSYLAASGFTAAILYTLSMHLLSVLRGLRRFAQEARVVFASECAILVFAGFASYITHDASTTVSVLVLGRLLQFAVIWHRCAKDGYARIQWASITSLKTGLVSGSPYLAQFWLSAALIYVDSLVVAAVMDDASSGLYQGAVRLLIAISFFSAILNAVYIPLISRQKAGGVSLESRQLVVLGFAGGAVSAIILYAWFDRIIEVTLGPSFKDLADYAGLIAIVLSLRYVNAGMGAVYTSTGYQQQRVVFLAVANVVAIVAAIQLIPTMGIYGGFMTALVSSSTLFAAYFGGLMTIPGLRRRLWVVS